MMIRLRFPYRLFGIMSVVAICASAALSASAKVSVKASLNSNTIRTNESATLSLQIQADGGEDLGQVELPKIEGLNFVELGVSSSGTSITVVNGRVMQVSNFTKQYDVLASKEGKYAIKGIRIPYGNTYAQANDLTLTVLKGNAQPAPPSGAEQKARSNPYNIILVSEQNKKEVYVGEQLQLTYTAYFPVPVNRLSIDDRSGQFQKFYMETFDMMNEKYRSQQVFQGRRYLKTPLRRYFLYALTPGEHTIDPLKISCEVLTGGLNSFFNRSHNNVDVVSEPVQVKVKPLPDEGKPDIFQGAVGQYHLDAVADRTEVEEGEPITLTITLNGFGNIRNAPTPILPDLNKFSMFDPTTEPNINVTENGVSGEVIYTHVLIPQDITADSIGPVRFAFFDPQKKAYQTLETESIPLKITASHHGGISSAYSGNANRRIPTRLSDDFRFIAVTPAALLTVPLQVYFSPVFWGCAFVPVLILGAAYWLKRRMEYFQLNPEIAKSKKAPRLAVKLLSDAKAALGERDVTKTYSALSKAVTDFINHRWNLACAGLTANELQQKLSASDIEPECIERVVGLMQDFDNVRFSGAHFDFQTMQNDYERTQDLISDLMKQKA